MLNNEIDWKLCYLIGYLSGDGNFCGGFGKRTDRLSVTTADVEVVEWLNNNFIEFNQDRGKLNDNLNRGIIAQAMSYTKTFPSSWEATFLKFGILCLKRDREIMNIPADMMPHYLRGLLDADGCITYGFRKDRNQRFVGKVVFTHQSIKLLGQIDDYLKATLGIRAKIAKKRGEDCHTLSFSKLGDIKAFGNHVYEHSSFVVLSRKYEKFREFESVLKDRVDSGKTFPIEFMKSWGFRSLVGSFSKYMFIDPQGREFPSLQAAADAHNETKRLTRQRCNNNVKGWSKRLKTDDEKAAYNEFVNQEIRKIFVVWLEENRNVYSR